MEPIFSNITIILSKPKYSENIGSAARAMCNMGFSNLTLIAPQNFDIEKVKKTATHESICIVNNIRIFDTLKEAIENSHYIVGTTARLGKQRQETIPPSEIAQKISPLSQNNHIAVLFGPEDRGLENADLKYCDSLVNIQTGEFSSINLSHSVMILCYELSKSLTNVATKKAPRLASKNELESMFDNLEKVLNKSSYINPENPGYYISKFRQFFSRLNLKPGEVLIVNGLLKKILVLFTNR